MNTFIYLFIYLFTYLSQKQKEMLRALQSGGKVIVKPRKTQSAGFWGALLASIGVSLTIETIRKISGKGAPRIGITDHSRTRRSLPSTSKKGDGIVNPYALKAREKRPGDEVAPHIPPPLIGT